MQLRRAYKYNKKKNKKKINSFNSCLSKLKHIAYTSITRRVARIFRVGVGVGVRSYKLVGGSGGMLPRENFRNFEMP